MLTQHALTVPQQIQYQPERTCPLMSNRTLQTETQLVGASLNPELLRYASTSSGPLIRS